MAGVSSTELNKLSISFVRPKADSAQVRGLAQSPVQSPVLVAHGSAMAMLCPPTLSVSLPGTSLLTRLSRLFMRRSTRSRSQSTSPVPRPRPPRAAAQSTCPTPLAMPL